MRGGILQHICCAMDFLSRNGLARRRDKFYGARQIFYDEEWNFGINGSFG
jgi:hypothetical protein